VLLVAIEGPCCAGKTTLADGIVASLGGSQVVTVVPDYADFVGGGAHMPDPAPRTLAEELHAIDILLDIETRRFDSVAVDSNRTRLVIVDRSALTLVAHANGLDWEMEERYDYRPEVSRIVLSDVRAVIPSSVIYVDISEQEQLRRNRGKFDERSIFMQNRYNRGFAQFFRDMSSRQAPWSQVVLDGEQPSMTVLEQGISALVDWDPSLLEGA
jgi:thymidylate kinase